MEAEGRPNGDLGARPPEKGPLGPMGSLLALLPPIGLFVTMQAGYCVKPALAGVQLSDTAIILSYFERQHHMKDIAFTSVISCDDASHFPVPDDAGCI